MPHEVRFKPISKDEVEILFDGKSVVVSMELADIIYRALTWVSIEDAELIEHGNDGAVYETPSGNRVKIAHIGDESIFTFY